MWIQEKYNLGDYFYIDVWPAANPLLISLHPSITNQFTVGEHSAPKDPGLVDFLLPVGGPNNLVCDDGQKWKTWRKAFNPGFSLTHLMTVVPDIVDIVSTFHELMDRKVDEGKVFRLETIATKLVSRRIPNSTSSWTRLTSIRPWMSSVRSYCKRSRMESPPYPRY